MIPKEIKELNKKIETLTKERNKLFGQFHLNINCDTVIKDCLTMVYNPMGNYLDLIAKGEKVISIRIMKKDKIIQMRDYLSRMIKLFE